MIKLFTFFFTILPLILSWIYLFIAIFSIVVHIKNVKNKTSSSISLWVFTIVNTAYALFFLITWIFFNNVWKQFFSVLGILAIIISSIWSNYNDKLHGRRWGYW